MALKKFIAQKAVKNSHGKLDHWEDDKEFSELVLAEAYCKQTYGPYTNPGPDLPMTYFGSHNPDEEWNGKLIIR